MKPRSPTTIGQTGGSRLDQAAKTNSPAWTITAAASHGKSRRSFASGSGLSMGEMPAMGLSQTYQSQVRLMLDPSLPGGG